MCFASISSCFCSALTWARNILCPPGFIGGGNVGEFSAYYRPGYFVDDEIYMPMRYYPGRIEYRAFIPPMRRQPMINHAGRFEFGVHNPPMRSQPMMDNPGHFEYRSFNPQMRGQEILNHPGFYEDRPLMRRQEMIMQMRRMRAVQKRALERRIVIEQSRLSTIESEPEVEEECEKPVPSAEA